MQNTNKAKKRNMQFFIQTKIELIKEKKKIYYLKLCLYINLNKKDIY